MKAAAASLGEPLSAGAVTPGAWRELGNYLAHMRDFGRSDWVRYTSWMATIFSLLFGTAGFVIFGALHGTVWPGYVWFVPLGNVLFCTALAVDDIGHRTVYKQDLRRGEAYIHQMIVATAVPSVMALCLCYQHPSVFRMPALALIFLSLFYSAIDEALHWQRYLTKGLDRVEMWSHFVAILGHVVMIAAWWQWYAEGYQGVAETVAKLAF